MEFIGYLAIIVVGLTLAIIGGGGSILTVPILVYMFDLSAEIATSYSLFLVGLSAVVGAYGYAKQGLVAYRVGATFAAPAFLGVFLVRRFLVPLLPDEVVFESITVSKDQIILGVFSLVMLMAAVSMIKGRKDSQGSKTTKLNIPLIALEGLIVGGVTGFVGAGGGFLIIPALVLLAGLPMKEAVGTSLLIIAFKSLFGFTGDLGNLPIDWGFLVSISALSILGIFVGGYFAKFISSERLKPAFGYFVLIMGAWIFIQQVV